MASTRLVVTIGAILSFPLFVLFSREPVEPPVKGDLGPAWEISKEAPAFRERMDNETYGKRSKEALARVRESKRYPPRGLRIVEVTPGTQAERLGIKVNDVMLLFDGMYSWDSANVTKERDGPVQMVLVSSDGTSRNLTIQPGLIGIRWKRFARDDFDPAAVNVPKDQRWDSYIEVARNLPPQQDDLIEAALFRAKRSGCPPEGLYGLGAEVALNGLRFDDALAFSWLALKHNEGDRLAAQCFRAAAIATGRPFLAWKTTRDLAVWPEGSDPAQVPERLVPWAMEARIPDKDEMGKFFREPVLLQGKGLSSNGRTTLRNLLRNGWTSYDPRVGSENEVLIGPPVEKAEMRCAFSFRPTDRQTPAWGRWVMIALLDASKDKTELHPKRFSAVYETGTRLRLLRPSYRGRFRLGVTFRPPIIRVWTLCPELNYAFPAGAFYRNPGQRHVVEWFVFDGTAKLTLDDQLLYLGPVPASSSKLVANIDVSGHIMTLDAFALSHLLNEEERKARVDPVLNDRYLGGRTRLHYFIQNWNEKLSRELVTKGCDLNIKDDYGETPLHLAIRRQRTALVEFMLSRGPQLDIVAAAALGKRARVAELLKKNPDEAFERRPWPPLLGAARCGDIEIARMLLDRGADVNQAAARNFAAFTPLICAISRKQKAMVEFLLKRGADPNISLWNGTLPVALAKEMDQPEIVALLTAYGGLEKKAKNEPEVPRRPIKPPWPPPDEF